MGIWERAISRYGKVVLSKMGSTTLPDRSSIRFALAVAFLPAGIAAISGICPDRQELLPTASAGIRSTFGTLFKAFPQIQHLVTAGLKAAIFAVLGVDSLAAVFTLDSAHTGGAINEIFHQGVLIFAFPLFCCHRHPPLAVTGVWWIMKSIICPECYGYMVVTKW